MHEKARSHDQCFPTPVFGSGASLPKTSGGTAKLEPCRNCKAQAEETLQVKDSLAAEKGKHDKTKKEKEKADKVCCLPTIFCSLLEYWCLFPAH